MAKWIEDPQAREEVEHVTEEIKLPIYKASAKGEFRPWLKECWDKIEGYLLNLKQSLKEEISGKEPTISKKTGFNLDKTDTLEDNSNKLLSAKGGYDLDTSLKKEIAKKLDTGYLVGRQIKDTNSEKKVGVSTVYVANGTKNKPINVIDAAMFTMAYSNEWYYQILGDWNNGDLHVRGGSKTLNPGPWLKLWHDKNLNPKDYWGKDKVNGVEGIAFNGVGIYLGNNNEVSFDSQNNQIVFNYRPKKNGQKITEFCFFAGDASNHATIYAGDIFSNAERTALLRHIEELGGAKYNGFLNQTGDKIADAMYFDTNTKEMFICKKNTNLTSPNPDYFEPVSNYSLLKKMKGALKIDVGITGEFRSVGAFRYNFPKTYGSVKGVLINVCYPTTAKTLENVYIVNFDNAGFTFVKDAVQGSDTNVTKVAYTVIYN